MTTSETLRLILAIILLLIYLAKRYDLLGKLRQKQQKKGRLEARQRRLESKKEQRQREEEQAQKKKSQTAEILRRGLGYLRQKTVEVAGDEIWYLESAAKPGAESVLLLHGFAGDKEIWGDVAKLLIAEGFYLIAPDLPGFGQSSKDPDKPYDVTSQAKRIRLFTQKMGLGRFHLVGHSLGGSIAAAVAYAAPEEVASLTLIEPFGIHVPYESELDELLAQGRNPMVIANPAAYDNLLGFVFHKTPEMPPALKQLRAERAAKNRVLHLKVWQETREGERANLLDLLLPVIEVRTLLVQGSESRVIHPSTPDVVRAMMSTARTAIIQDCGHFPMVENPPETARHLLAFMTAVAPQP